MSAHAAAVAAASPRAAAPVAEARAWVPALLFGADVAALEVSVLLARLAREAASPWYPVSITPSQYSGIALGILIMPLACWASGLYPGYGLSTVERLRRRTKAVFFSFAGLIAWGYLAQHEEWSRGILLAAMLFASLLAPLVERLLIRRLLQARLWGSPVAVFGSVKHGAARVAAQLRRHPSLGLNPVSVLDLECDAPAWSGRTLSMVAQLHLRETGMAERIQTAVVALPELGPVMQREFVEALPFRYVVLMTPGGYPQSHSITALDLGGDLGLALTRNLLIPWNRSIKRVIDVVLSILLLALAVPLLAACVVWIKRVSPGNAFYVQPRIGYRRRVFGMWKLRTMYPDAEQLLETCLAEDPALAREWREHCKLRRDPRVLPGIGRFLRRTSLDELPQLWNVLRGEMSLVGPRPFPAYHLAHYDEEFRRFRECVTPGMTGLWQVSSRAGELEELDSYYIRNWSLWLDIDIAVRTVRAVWCGRGAC
ncbi:MAG: exopolysaccharide biosynthesis polyprenyl glycosylphosphotransferase [Bryobacterales bacterium]|nr:exopolysaccharide biosynthesis polyprenyl glycosylphosphotransferase [Bryobacterales bacterium]